MNDETESTPEREDPVAAAREIYGNYYNETLKQREKGEDSAVELVAHLSDWDVEKTALDLANELAKQGDPSLCTGYLELTDLDEAGKLEILVKAEENAARIDEGLIRGAERRGRKQSSLEDAETLKQLKASFQKDAEQHRANSQILRKAASILKGAA